MPTEHEILRAAITLARAEQIKTVEALVNRLKQAFPGAESLINKALILWANRL